MNVFVAVLLGVVSWIGTWSAAPSSADAKTTLSDVTLRQVVHVSAGGTQVRVRLTNRFGDAPVAIDAVSIAEQDGSAAAAQGGTLHAVSFSGERSVTLPAHADVISDPVALPVAPESNVLISLYVRGPIAAPTYHHLSYQDNFSAPGDRVMQASASGFSTAQRSWYLLDAVDVAGSPVQGTVAVLGDSITNGQGSTVAGNNRWSDDLARRLLASKTPLGVVNEAIDGNRILLDSPQFGPSAVARFDDDVLAQSGVRDLIVLLGINDIQQTPHQYDAGAIEAGLTQIVRRAHAHGIRVIGCTITPYGGWFSYAMQGDGTRQAVNRFIRSSGVFDGVADFDAVVRDPNDPRRLAPQYDSGDHLHPNAAAYRAMAAAVPLERL